MSSKGGITPGMAATVYDLADNLVQLRFYAERRWCSSEPDEALPENVDVLVGRVLLLAENLAHDGAFAAPAEMLGQCVNSAWNHYKGAWQSRQHREITEHLD